MRIIPPLLLAMLASPVFAQQPTPIARDAMALLPAVAQAIEDEIYDLKREGQFFEIDGNGGGADTPASISMYVLKEVSANGTGAVIYKNMPLGEVYRYFTVDSDGVVTLSGSPNSKFPMHGGSFLTIYTTSEEVSKFVMEESYKGKFVIDPKAPKKRIQDAEKRQISRIGFSFRLNKGPGFKAS